MFINKNFNKPTKILSKQSKIKYLKKMRNRTFSLVRSRINIFKQSATQYPKWGYKFTEPFRQKPQHIQLDERYFTAIIIFYPQKSKQ